MDLGEDHPRQCAKAPSSARLNAKRLRHPSGHEEEHPHTLSALPPSHPDHREGEQDKFLLRVNPDQA